MADDAYMMVDGKTPMMRLKEICIRANAQLGYDADYLRVSQHVAKFRVTCTVTGLDGKDVMAVKEAKTKKAAQQLAAEDILIQMGLSPTDLKIIYNPGEDAKFNPPYIENEYGEKIFPPVVARPTVDMSSSCIGLFTDRLLKIESGYEGERKRKFILCPYCDEPKIDNITEHLGKQHPYLNARLSRLPDDLLYCLKCTATFPTDDIEIHIKFCKGYQSFMLKTAVIAPRGRAPAIIPPGIGCSPIVKMECEDLASLETVKAAMTCGVCGKQGERLGFAAECLKTHGVIRCPLCFNTYLNPDNYSLHVREVHARSPGQTMCPLCPNMYLNIGQAMHHLNTRHWASVTGYK